MLFKSISYGYKYYEGEGKIPPEHDYLFNLRDLANPYWVPELKPYNGLDREIIQYFEQDANIQNRVNKIVSLIKDFIEDAFANPSRDSEKEFVVAFRCTGGKHRSVYFAQS